MSYFTTKYRKYYVRVCLGGNNSLSHQTLGPYTQKDALNMVLIWSPRRPKSTIEICFQYAFTHGRMIEGRQVHMVQFMVPTL